MTTDPDTHPSTGAQLRAASDLIEATEGHLGRAGDPVEGRDPDSAPEIGDMGGVNVSDHLGAAGDPVEGA